MNVIVENNIYFYKNLFLKENHFLLLKKYFKDISVCKMIRSN